MSNTQRPKARSENLVIQILPDETLVYDLTNNEAHCLNETAGFIWSRCNGDSSIDGIARSVEARFGRAVDVDLVRLGVAQLSEKNLLAKNWAERISLPSRRDVIKKIGLASAIALPVIASIVAPPNAMGNISCGCISPVDCRGQAGNACPPNAFTCNPSGICVVQ